MQTPIATFQSGPVNSLRGAAALCCAPDGPSPLEDGAIVLDIGGTTTDVGALVRGLPRPAPRAVQLAGQGGRAGGQGRGQPQEVQGEAAAACAALRWAARVARAEGL